MGLMALGCRRGVAIARGPPSTPSGGTECWVRFGAGNKLDEVPRLMVQVKDSPRFREDVLRSFDRTLTIP
jgi:hypothetical protein